MKRNYRLTYTKNGKRKYTLLYRRWKDLNNRCKRGYGTRTPHLYHGLEVGWKTFHDFRTWAICNGFSKRNSSPDRQDATLGYFEGNVIWRTISANQGSRRSWQYMTDEPPPSYYGDDEHDIPFPLTGPPDRGTEVPF